MILKQYCLTPRRGLGMYSNKGKLHHVSDERRQDASKACYHGSRSNACVSHCCRVQLSRVHVLKQFHRSKFNMDLVIALSRLTLHSTRLCMVFKISRKKIFFGTEVTAEVFSSTSQNLKVGQLQRGPQMKFRSS
jgi:hypothetical protein